MTFLIVTHVVHKQHQGQYWGYAPYVREMNLWIKYVDEVIIVAPIMMSDVPDPIEISYQHPKIRLIPVPDFNIKGFGALLKTAVNMPGLLNRLFRAMAASDHIHLRCPGNMGLLGSIVQIFFPSKKKTAKYAGNWDPQSQQPWSYRLQKWILNNTFLTRNMRVLVYGSWTGSSKNILPFFTASYLDSDKQICKPRSLDVPLKLIYAGALVPGKNPMLAVKATHALLEKNINATLNIYGEGSERKVLELYIRQNQLEDRVVLHGNKPAEILKKAYQESHFLVFVSESEGWPKVVAEAMFWGCLPITTAVSCVPEMIGYGERGALISPDFEEITNHIIGYINTPDVYKSKVIKAIQWSQAYTLDRFESEIIKLI